MKKQFLPILVLLGILFTSASCKINNRHEIGGDIPGDEIENPLPNPEPDKPTPEPEPDTKPNPDEGDNNKPTPEPDEPNPDEGDNNKPTPEPDKPNPDEGDNSKPTPEPETPELIQDFTFISLTPEYDKVTFDYTTTKNTVVQEIALLNITSNKIEQTLFNGEKVFKNAHRFCDYKLKFNYSNSKDDVIKTFYTKAFSLKRPTFSMAFKSATVDKNNINYELEIQNNQYFETEHIDVSLYKNNNFIKTINMMKSSFTDLEYFTEYTLQADIEYHDRDSSISNVFSCKATVKTELRTLDGTELKVMITENNNNSFKFDVYSDIHYIFEKGEVIDVSTNDEKIVNTFTNEGREVTGLLSGHAYKLKYYVKLPEYNLSKFYLSDIIYTDLDLPLLQLSKTYYKYHRVYYCLKQNDMPCCSFSDLNVYLLCNGEKIAMKSDALEGTFDNVPRSEYYYIEYNYNKTHPIFGTEIEGNLIPSRIEEITLDNEFNFTNIFSDDNSISFASEQGTLVTPTKFELYEDDILVQSIEGNNNKFNYKPITNANYYIKAYFTVTGQSNIYTSTSYTYKEKIDITDNLIFKFDYMTKNYSLELLNAKNAKLQVHHVCIYNDAGHEVGNYDFNTGTFTNLVDNAAYYVLAYFQISDGNETINTEKSWKIKNSIATDDVQLATYISSTNILDYKVTSKSGININSVSLYDYSVQGEETLINTMTTATGSFEYNCDITLCFIRIEYTTSDSKTKTIDLDLHNSIILNSKI